jgi:hypothetical protein
MVNYARVEHHIDRGRGKAAQKLGPPFLAYRLTSTSSGDFPDGWTPTPGPLGTLSFPIFRRRMTEGKLEVALKNVALLYEIIANMEPFLIGDVFVQNDPPYVPGVSYGAGATQLYGTMEFTAMCFALHSPVGKSVGARIDRRVAIYRPAGAPQTLTDGSLYWESTHDNDQPLLLANGAYSFGPAGSGEAVMVPAGWASQHRQSEKTFGPGVPGMLKPIKYFFYLPPLPGYLAREGDAIIDENGARYVVVSLFEQQAGVVGQYLVVDRKIAQGS